MSYGLELFNSDGTINLRTSGRLVRYVGSISIPDDVSTTYPWPGMSNDGTWLVIPSAEGTSFSLGSLYTGLDITIISNGFTTTYHGGSASKGLSVEFNIFRV